MWSLALQLMSELWHPLLQLHTSRCFIVAICLVVFVYRKSNQRSMTGCHPVLVVNGHGIERPVRKVRIYVESQLYGLDSQLQPRKIGSFRGSTYSAKFGFLGGDNEFIQGDEVKEDAWKIILERCLGECVKQPYLAQKTCDTSQHHLFALLF